MSREERIDLVKQITAAQGTEEEIGRNLQLLMKNVPDPRVSNYIFGEFDCHQLS